MPTPSIQKKSTKALTITEGGKKLFRAVYAENNKPEKTDESVPRIKVSVLISKMAFYYEKIRNSVEYKEEHLLRKNAIERILKRLIIIEGSINIKGINSQQAAHDLLTELIRAGYLPNNTLPETVSGEVSVIISKYLGLKQIIAKDKNISGEEKGRLMRWTMAVMASEIEEKLGRSQIDEAIVTYMFEILNEKISLPEDSPYINDREIQVYVSILRNYYKYDNDMIAYVLFKYYNDNWVNADAETINKVGAGIAKLEKAIRQALEHPLAMQMNRITSQYTVYFSILKDVVSDNPVAVYESFYKDPKAFPRLIKNAAEKRYRDSKTKLWRAAVRSIIYIFLTKSIFAILLEVPASRWFGEDINPLSLAINITFPALLLFIVVLFTRMPGDDNSKKIVDGINSLTFIENKNTDQYKLRQPLKRGAGLSTVFGLFYAVTFFATFGLVIWALDKIQFSWVSITIFLFFLAFVSFFSIRIRKNAKELLIVEPKENLISFVIDFFYVPVVQTGKYLSEKFAKINVFVFILDFIIEAPFKIFVEIAEEWTKYVRERKDEIA